ncbi:MAG: AAA family ATPase [Candidatus Eisenbacteria bacterium]|nr:AAA family ATPase [Candidatus Eisenbacteria bacterium]
MMDEIGIVIIDRDEDMRFTLRGLLRDVPGASVKAESGDLRIGVNLVRQYRPHIVLLEVSTPPEEFLSAAAKIVEVCPQSAVFAICSETKPEIILRAMRSGVQEFLRRPPDQDELVASVRKVMRRLQAVGTIAGEIVTIFSNKGGLGTTMISANLAVFLAQDMKKSCAIVDLDLQFGDVAMFLNVQPNYTIADVTRSYEKLDQTLLKAHMTQHPSGVYVMAEPHQAEEAETITAEQVGQVLRLMRSMFEFVIVDTAHAFDERSVEALDLSDSIFMVSALELPAIRNTKRCIEIFQRLGYGQDKVKLVLNRFIVNKSNAAEKFERGFEYPIFWRIPNDYGSVSNSINTGVPLLESAPQSPVTQNLRELAATLSGGSAERGSDEVAPKKGGLARLLRR